MLKNLQQVSNQIHKDGSQNGKEKATRRKARKEVIRHKGLAQLECNRKTCTMQQTAPVQNKSLRKATKEGSDFSILMNILFIIK